MHLRELQAVLGLGGPCQSSSQGRRADRADGVVHLHSGSDLVSPDGSSIAPLSVPALVHQEGRTIVRRYVDDPEAGQLPGKNPTTASRTVWPENLDRPGHRASQPNRVSDTSTEDPASSTSSRSIRRGEFHPPGRSRTPSKSTKRELSRHAVVLQFVSEREVHREQLRGLTETIIKGAPKRLGIMDDPQIVLFLDRQTDGTVPSRRPCRDSFGHDPPPSVARGRRSWPFCLVMSASSCPPKSVTVRKIDSNPAGIGKGFQERRQ